MSQADLKRLKKYNDELSRIRQEQIKAFFANYDMKKNKFKK